MTPNLLISVLGQAAGERSITMVVIICLVVVVAIVGVAIGSFIDKRNNPNGIESQPRVDWEKKILEGPVVPHEFASEKKVAETEPSQINTHEQPNQSHIGESGGDKADSEGGSSSSDSPN